MARRSAAESSRQYPDANAALVREFDGILEQVGNDLRQVMAIRANERLFRADVDFQIELLLSDLWLDAREHIVQHLRHENRSGRQGDLSRFDLGEIEHVVDHAKQVFTAG